MSAMYPNIFKFFPAAKEHIIAGDTFAAEPITDREIDHGQCDQNECEFHGEREPFANRAQDKQGSQRVHIHAMQHEALAEGERYPGNRSTLSLNAERKAGTYEHQDKTTTD